MILNVVRTGWMNLRRDRAALMLSFVVPIVFFSIFAGVFGSTRSGTSRVRVAIVDEDGSERSRRLIAALKQERALRVLEQADEKAAAEVRAEVRGRVRARRRRTRSADHSPGVRQRAAAVRPGHNCSGVAADRRPL